MCVCDTNVMFVCFVLVVSLVGWRRFGFCTPDNDISGQLLKFRGRWRKRGQRGFDKRRGRRCTFSEPQLGNFGRTTIGSGGRWWVHDQVLRYRQASLRRPDHRPDGLLVPIRPPQLPETGHGGGHRTWTAGPQYVQHPLLRGHGCLLSPGSRPSALLYANGESRQSLSSPNVE